MAMKNCKVPDDCWGCIEYDECRIIEGHKETHRLPIIPTVAIAIVIATTTLGIVYLVMKCIKITLTYLPF